MSKTKEFDVLVDKATEETIQNLYKTCEWALTGDDAIDLLAGTIDYNDAHSYMMQLVVSKLASQFKL
jgi:hypothetical protein|tara:strand:- start:569 stop:769 length:201 start_codon:yes stop_codon:yes gene_type:complete